MNHKPFLFGLTLSLGLLANTAWSAQPTPLTRFDQNFDGFLSRAEFEQMRKQRQAKMKAQGMQAGKPLSFDQIDTNKDGRISRNELQQAKQTQKTQRMARIVKRFDQDGNGMLSQSEFAKLKAKRQAHMKAKGITPQRPFPTFEELDSNGDGQLSMTELQTMRKRNKQAARFAQFDLNSDGRITQEEFLKAQSQRIAQRSKAGYPMRNIGQLPTFEELDRNQDGYIVAEEFSAYRMQKRQAKKAP